MALYKSLSTALSKGEGDEVNREICNMLEQLNGIFAFALYDEERDEFLIARDPIGVIPLWIDTLKKITSEAVSDEQMAHADERFPINPPKNKEEYYYRSIFAEHFPSESAAKSVPSDASVACSTAVALEWDAAFKNMNAPSGRAVKGVHEQAY